MKVIQFFLRGHRLFGLLLALLALQAAPCHGQVIITNGLVDYYPLTTINSDGVTTPDVISRRDMTLINMNSNNIVSDTHPGIESNDVMNFNQAGGPTLIYYRTTGQTPLAPLGGDFLPFINQRGATMNFWVKGNAVSIGSELRVMAECANDGDAQPFFSISGKPGNAEANYFLRNDPTNAATDPNGVACEQLDDGTYQLPCVAYEYNQGSQNTSATNPVLDGNWHMLTTTIDTNGDFHVFVDGIYDPGLQSGGPYTDHEGNLAIGLPLDVTNMYYTTNLYPYPSYLPGQPYGGSTPASNPPPNGYVCWVSKLNYTADTTFGGFIRNSSQAGGLVCRLSDIGFWNRVLSTNEIQFVFTNGLLSWVSNNVTWTGTVSFVTTSNVTYADYSWFLLGYMGENLVNTGPLIRTNNTFWYNFDLLETSCWEGCPQIIVHETTPVDLGTLAPGVYTLITTSWGAPVMTNTFTIAPVLNPNGFDTNGYFQIQMSSGVTNVNYVLQCSTDFVNWTSLSTYTVSTNTVGVALTDYYPVLPGVCFYRVLCQ